MFGHLAENYNASIAQLAEHALRKRMVVGSIPTGGFIFHAPDRANIAWPATCLAKFSLKCQLWGSNPRAVACSGS